MPEAKPWTLFPAATPALFIHHVSFLDLAPCPIELIIVGGLGELVSFTATVNSVFWKSPEQISMTKDHELSWSTKSYREPVTYNLQPWLSSPWITWKFHIIHGKSGDVKEREKYWSLNSAFLLGFIISIFQHSESHSKCSNCLTTVWQLASLWRPSPRWQETGKREIS